ncbi:MAG: nitrogenase component 1 [Eubacteriales bacterium]|jgi:nitrogenase molybdenum-iron protein beta chain
MKNRFIERPRSFCALGGAMLTAGAIPGAVPILHTAMGCGGSIYWNQVGSTGYLGAGYCGGMAVPSSNVKERDIIFGGTDRLAEQISNTVKLVEGDLYIVLTGCMTDIIGDDIQAVIRDFQAQDVPIIGAETGGFKGDAYKGYDLVLQTLIKNLIAKKEQKVDHKVNLWGIVPAQDAFWRGNLNNLRVLLSKLGLEVNSFFTENDTLDSVKNSGDAALNIVVSEFYGIEAADLFLEVHGVPYITSALPIGAAATEEFLHKIGEALKIEKDVTNKVIDREKSIYYKYIDRIADTYNDQDFQRYAVVVGDGNYAAALTRFLADDLGWLPELTIVTDNFEDEKKNKINKYLERVNSGYKTKVIYETDASEIQYHLSRHWPVSNGQRFYDAFSPAFVVGSHLERQLAKNIGAAHLTVTYPVGNRVVLTRGYTGYLGGLNMIEDILSVLVFER